MNATFMKRKMVGRAHRQNVLAEIRKHIGKPCPTNDQIGCSGPVVFARSTVIAVGCWAMAGISAVRSSRKVGTFTRQS